MFGTELTSNFGRALFLIDRYINLIPIKVTKAVSIFVTNIFFLYCRNGKY